MSRLSPGTQIANWCVVAWQAQGAYGAVYRALPVGQEHVGPVALKFALYPWDARFAREAELLSRLHHPSIPRVLGRGIWRTPSGAEHPFFAMEWIEGTPLYSWAQQHALSSRQACLLLASLARALEAIHAAHAVHRDVKGDNILVRHSDGRPMLIDFGSCYFEGAPRLTWQSLAPWTPGYLSAQACLFDIRSRRHPDSYYPPTPADDVFALGVTAYRLVMGDYPPPMDAQQDEAGEWRVFSPDPRPLLESNPRVEPVLRELILRMLSDSPEARGTAKELAKELEAAAGETAPAPLPASPPAVTVSPPKASLPVGTRELPEPAGPRAHEYAWKSFLGLAATGVAAVLVCTLQPASEHNSSGTQQVSASQASDAGTSAVGETSPTVASGPAQPPSKPKPIAQERPPEPRPGQMRTDAKGRCTGRMQVAINGGCWVEANSAMTAEACVENGYVFFNGKCYSPALAPPQKPVPTSSPAKPQ